MANHVVAAQLAILSEHGFIGTWPDAATGHLFAWTGKDDVQAWWRRQGRAEGRGPWFGLYLDAFEGIHRMVPRLNVYQRDKADCLTLIGRTETSP
jgi:hypothetical protein